jgi:hypothetical protein
MEKDNFFDFLDEISQPQSIPSLSKLEKEPPESMEQVIPNEKVALLLFPFFIDMIDQFKGKLNEIRNHARVHHDKCGDKEFITRLSQIIMEEIKRTDLVQNSLVNYIRISNPILKSDTINALIEEELKKCQMELEGRKLKLFKTFEKNLPEIAVPDDQLRYILSCLLQYVLASMPSGGGVGLYTRSIVLQGETGEHGTPGGKDGRQIEILLVYAAYRKSTGQLAPTPEVPARRRGGILDLTLRLVDEVVRRNRGMMKFEEDEKNQKTTICLRFPVERRKVVYYQAAGELTRQSKTTFEKLSSLEEMKKRG